MRINSRHADSSLALSRNLLVSCCSCLGAEVIDSVRHFQKYPLQLLGVNQPQWGPVKHPGALMGQEDQQPCTEQESALLDSPLLILCQAGPHFKTGHKLGEQDLPVVSGH